ncbi:ribosomal protein L6 [Nitrosococcus halophilus Nc 4]|uniref:Large ribosomal subunit protein uL6 n=1 Tax=Nitrosococcus halophilus (strain Nc4) TaxID=472759 RepID=D5BVQ9_NITHN|nr:50S ribosomal protein L6 [Nitrosococcus halophilus]ADE15488.1 ribosomal protein L6 [Nitrosococcus halophilus Nc 4]
MSRIANNPVPIPKGVEVTFAGNNIEVKGTKGSLGLAIHPLVQIIQEGEILSFAPKGVEKQARALSGTTRALVSNMVQGVSQGFERRLQLVGVGYRAQMQGQKLVLNLGFSHPIEFTAPANLTIEVPSPTEIVIKGADKQQVGQVAANIRRFRPPEPYKGKGVRYADEIVVRKEAKKK